MYVHNLFKNHVFENQVLFKVVSFHKVRFIFQISKSPKQIIPNHYPDLEIWISCLLWAGNSKFKFRIVIWNNFFWDLEVWKMNFTFWKKATFTKNLGTFIREAKIGCHRTKFVPLSSIRRRHSSSSTGFSWMIFCNKTFKTYNLACAKCSTFFYLG